MSQWYCAYPPPKVSWSAQADHPRLPLCRQNSRGWSAFADHDKREIELRHDTEFARLLNRLGAALNLELSEEAGDVGLDRVRRDIELAGDLPVRAPGRQ